MSNMTDTQDMSWDELVEKAKELGYEYDKKLISFGCEYNIENLINFKNSNACNFVFTKDGNVLTDEQIVVEGRTPDQMYQIMLALN